MTGGAQQFATSNRAGTTVFRGVKSSELARQQSEPFGKHPAARANNSLLGKYPAASGE
jgi:hypothetical protein